jgi:hypothetical protein
MKERFLAVLMAVIPLWTYAQQDRVVLTQEAHAELQAFAEKNGYKTLSAAYVDFLAARADQKKEAKEQAENRRKEGASLAVDLKQVEAKLSTERANLEILEMQRAVEMDIGIRMRISERINRSKGRIESLEIERESLQKQIEDAERAAAAGN